VFARVSLVPTYSLERVQALICWLQPTGNLMLSSNKDIFRKVTLERLSSPDELDRLMQITQPRAWLLLLALAGLLAAALVWAIFGTIVLDVPVSGVLVTADAPPADPAVSPSPDAIPAGPPLLDAVVYTPEADAVRVVPGQEARLLLPGISAEQSGFLLGTVTAIDGAATPPETLIATLGETAAANLSAVGPVIAVRIALTPDATAPSGYRWTALQGAATPLRAGMAVHGTIIVQQLRPISFVLGGAS